MLKNLTKILLPIFATSLFVEFYEGEKEVYIASFLLLALLFAFQKNITQNDIVFSFEDTSFNRWSIGFWILLVLFFNLILQNKLLNFETITWDVPSYLVASQEIGLGNLPLETQWESKGPMLLYIYYFISELVDKNYIYFRIFNDFILFISIFLIYKIVNKTTNNSSLKSVLSMFIFTLLVSFEWFISEFSEIYCLIILGLIYLVFENVDNVSVKHFLIGFLISISTLINQGTIIFIFPYLIVSLYRNKLKNFKTTFLMLPGFLIPHTLFLVIYSSRGMLDVYLSNYFRIPLEYTSANASSFYELRVILRRFFQYDQYLYFVIILVFFCASYEIYKKIRNKNFEIFFDLDILNLVFALLFYFIADHNYAHHLFYFIFYFAIFSKRLFSNQVVIMMILVGLSSISILGSSYNESLKNLSNLNETYENYPLRILSEDILSELETNDFNVLALDYVLVLYYLEKPNVSYIIHPGNHYEDFILKELYRMKKIQKNEFSHISYYIELEPNVILCNPVGIISGKAEKLDFYNCSVDDYKKNYTKLNTDSIKSNPNLDLYSNPYESINVYIKNLD